MSPTKSEPNEHEKVENRENDSENLPIFGHQYSNNDESDDAWSVNFGRRNKNARAVSTNNIS